MQGSSTPPPAARDSKDGGRDQQWRFAQCFGDKGEVEDITEGASLAFLFVLVSGLRERGSLVEQSLERKSGQAERAKGAMKPPSLPLPPSTSQSLQSYLCLTHSRAGLELGGRRVGLVVRGLVGRGLARDGDDGTRLRLLLEHAEIVHTRPLPFRPCIFPLRDNAGAGPDLCFACRFVADIISTVEFDHTGDYLATGDKGGRVVLFERNEQVRPIDIFPALCLRSMGGRMLTVGCLRPFFTSSRRRAASTSSTPSCQSLPFLPPALIIRTFG